MSLLALSLSKSGERAEAGKLLGEMKSESARRYVPNYFLGIVHMALGEKDEAFAALEKDIAKRSPYCTTFAIDPSLDDLRADPRFEALLQKVAAAKID